MGKSTPKAPNYTAAAEAQGQSSKEVTNMQTWANRPDQYTPFGSQTWDSNAVRDPATGQMVTQWTQNTNLTPEAQAALDAQLQLQQGRSELGASLMPRAEAEFGQAMDWSQFSPMGARVAAPQYGTENLQRSLSSEGLPGINPASRYYDEAGDALYGKFAERADPRFAREESGLQSRLYAQGLREGDAAYDNAMTDFNQRKDDAYSQAAYDATLKSGEEASRIFGMDSSARGQLFGERGTQGAFANSAAQQAFGQNLGAGGANFSQAMQASGYDNQLRQQQIAEEMQQRGFSLNEINAILTGQQVGMPSMPNFSNATKSDSTNYLAAAQNQGQYNLDAFNAQQAGLQGWLSGAGSLAQGAMMFSDRRLKRNIRFIGTWKGRRWYEYDIGDRHEIGVMADENVDIAVKHPSGYFMVDYGSL